LNFAQGFRQNKSPVNLYLASSNNSPSANHCESDNAFCYQQNTNHNNNNNSSSSHNNNNIQLNNKNFESAHRNYNSDVNSRENSPRIESPRDKQRANTCSPEENSHSYSSHKNDDIGCLSPGGHNNDSLGSQSPENLSSKSQSNGANNNTNHPSGQSVSDMLDHKLNLSFLGPPLAALHSMTEMKSQNSPQTSQNAQCVTNPHGIDSILSRPTPVTNAHLNALGGKQ
jgi:hypothetical protein